MKFNIIRYEWQGENTYQSVLYQKMFSPPNLKMIYGKRTLTHKSDSTINTQTPLTDCTRFMIHCQSFQNILGGILLAVGMPLYVEYYSEFNPNRKPLHVWFILITMAPQQGVLPALETRSSFVQQTVITS